MEKSIAFTLMKSVMELSGQLNRIDMQLQNILDDQEKRQFLKVLGSIMVDLDAGLIRPLVREYPDLDPDRAREFKSTRPGDG